MGHGRQASREPSMMGTRALVLLAFLPAAITSSASAQEAPLLYTSHGVQVVQRVISDAELVSVRVYLLGGSRQLTENTQGIEPFVLRASQRGTALFPGRQTLDAQVATGSMFSVSATPDWTTFSFSGLADEFEPSWRVLADRITHPTLDDAAVEVARRQLLTEVRAQNNSPDAAAQRLAESLAFRAHPYRWAVNGTQASIAGLRTEDLVRYHEASFVRSRMLLAVTGPVDRVTVERSIGGTLGELPLGTYEWRMPAAWTREDADFAVLERALPTNYILGYFSGPSMKNEDYLAFEVALSVLSGVIAGEIRGLGLSYAAGARLVDRAASGGSIFVSTTDPADALDIINDAITRLGQSVIRRSNLRDYAEDSVLEYYLRNETSAQQAEYLARSFLLHGELESDERWLEKMREVSPGAVRRIFHDYVQNIQYGYLGDPELVPSRRLRWH
jgi:zinc protease